MKLMVALQDEATLEQFANDADAVFNQLGISADERRAWRSRYPENLEAGLLAEFHATFERLKVPLISRISWPGAGDVPVRLTVQPAMGVELTRQDYELTVEVVTQIRPQPPYKEVYLTFEGATYREIIKLNDPTLYPAGDDPPTSAVFKFKYGLRHPDTYTAVLTIDDSASKDHGLTLRSENTVTIRKAPP